MSRFRIHPVLRDAILNSAFRGPSIFPGETFQTMPDGVGARSADYAWFTADCAGHTKPAHGVRTYVPTQGMLDELTACRWGHPDPDLLDHVVCVRRGLIDDAAQLTARGREVLDATIGRRRARG